MKRLNLTPSYRFRYLIIIIAISFPFAGCCFSLGTMGGIIDAARPDSVDVPYEKISQIDEGDNLSIFTKDGKRTEGEFLSFDQIKDTLNVFGAGETMERSIIKIEAEDQSKAFYMSEVSKVVKIDKNELGDKWFIRGLIIDGVLLTLGLLGAGGVAFKF